MPLDLAAVQLICYDTALRGATLRGVFDDVRLVADAILLYHIKVEPDSFLVAGAETRVSGYIAGCVDTRRFDRLYRRRVLPSLVLRIATQGHWAHRICRRLLYDSMAYGRVLHAQRQRFLEAYPAHLHINVAQSARGAGMGSSLLAAFTAHLATHGVCGVHAVVQSPHGAAFFAEHGFTVLAHYQSPPLLHLPPADVRIMGLTCMDTHSKGKPELLDTALNGATREL